MKKIIQITEENYNEIISNMFQYKLENKFIMFINKKFPFERTIYYCFKENPKNNNKFNGDINGYFVRYQKIFECEDFGINIYRCLDKCKVFIF